MVVSRKITEGIYGGHQPRDVAAAVALGILAGALAGGNLSWAALLLAAILFNVHTRLFLAAWLASVLVAWFSRGGLETLGQFLLDGTPLGQAVGLLGDSTLVALLGWDEYALIGGLAAGATLAVLCAPVAYWMTRQLSHARLRPNADLPSANLPTAPEARPDDAHPPLVRVWYGPSSHERSVRQTMVPRRLRPYGLPATLAAAVTLVAATWSLARLSVERELWRQLSIYNGAQVSGASTHLSLATGDFIVHDLEIADAFRPDRDRFRVGVAKGRLSPGLLLRGRLNIERLVLSRVRADAARGQPAQLCGAGYVNPAVGPDDNVQGHLPSAGDLEISPYLRPWPSVCRRLGALEQLVAAIERLTAAEEALELSQAQGRLTGRRSDLGRLQPRVSVQALRVDGLPRAWNLGGKALVEVENLASNPSLVKKPAQVRILLPKFGAELLLDFASENGRPHTLRCSACDLDVVEWIDAPLAISGRAKLAGKGSFDRRGFSIQLLVEVEPLAAEVTCRGPLAGVEPALWNSGLRQLASFKAEAVCAGPWASPVVAVDSGPLVEQFKRRLQTAGQESLAATIERQITRYIERQAGLREEPPAGPAVVQAAALLQASGVEVEPAPVEPQTVPSQPGRCEFSSEDEYRVACDAAIPAGEQTGPYSSFSYPTTSAPYEDSEDVSPPASYPSRVLPPDLPPAVTPADDAAPPQRPLPGPVKMVVGRDRYTEPRTPHAFGGSPEAEPRESIWSRWTQGLRRKFSQTFAKPAAAPAESLDSADSLPEADDQAIPAAAGEAWYNRRWR
ncbi:MAG TPA: hypothetical protein VG125_05750 [Pirellulales bacterium]|jgi:hypothetical protein|nr:hypothetical protein [Pirellulales bacterium]